MSKTLADPVINGPFEMPSWYFEIGSQGPTGTILPGRRPSQSYIPIPPPKKGRGKAQPSLQDDLLSLPHESVAGNDLINALRRAMDGWRLRGYPGLNCDIASPPSALGGRHPRERIQFCQREAAETAIFLAEAAGRTADAAAWRKRLDEANAIYNDGLPCVAPKMANGSGETVVMTMLIAWQTLNKAYHPRDDRFTNRFHVVTPGVTIRDRLRALDPGDPGHHCDARDIMPATCSRSSVSPTSSFARPMAASSRWSSGGRTCTTRRRARSARTTPAIALWMIETDYNAKSFFVRHCYFTGGNEGSRLRSKPRSTDGWATLCSTVSRPFPAPSRDKIAVKVINDYGDEVMKIMQAQAGHSDD